MCSSDLLLGNAWKFTAKTSEPHVEFGRTQREEGDVYFVRDNGAGFNMAYAEKLFSPFQRLHREEDFPPEIRDRAVSLRMIAGGASFDAERVLDEILARYQRYLELADGGDSAGLWSAAVRRLPPRGTRASVRSGDRVLEGVIEGYSDTGAISLREDGRTEAVTLSAGEME